MAEKHPIDEALADVLKGGGIRGGRRPLTVEKALQAILALDFDRGDSHIADRGDNAVQYLPALAKGGRRRQQRRTCRQDQKLWPMLKKN
jgi:hypothetical protein